LSRTIVVTYDAWKNAAVNFQAEGTMRQVLLGNRAHTAIAVALLVNVVSAQSSVPKAQIGDYSLSSPANSKKAKPKTTLVEIELLQTDDGSGLYAQHWLKVLGPLDVSVRVHRPTSADKPDIKERDSGGVRHVTAIGLLDRTGRIAFPEKSFNVGDNSKLKEWVEELRTYGSRGTPTGKPLWGLTKEHFTALYEGLTKPVEFETLTMPLSQVAGKLPIPLESPLHWTAEATAAVARRATHSRLKVELKGLSTATALAIALHENGLGFRPNRTPQGDVELLIESISSKVEQWPIGWPLQQPKFKVAPRMFAVVPIELTDVPLADVIDAAAKLTETPILVDYFELEAKQIDLDKALVSYPQKKTTWDVALKTMNMSQKLTQELLQDEVGNPFVWVTTLRVGRWNDADKSKP
jgi:hypothetical protein